jgi:eukaryotic-like serine/threonine-protein kinase
MSVGAATSISSRYELLVKIASGGMATVYVGRLKGAAGLSRLVAIKRAHSKDNPKLRKALETEAYVATLLHHPNSVAVLDVEDHDGELWLVLEYVEGVSLFELSVALRKRRQTLPPAVAARILLDTAAGLHAVHELCDGKGAPLSVVHRDVSPQNILIGVDGVARIADLGIAKARVSFGERTLTGVVKGKLSYMAPEYLSHQTYDRRGDLFSLGIVAWELFAGRNFVPALIKRGMVPLVSSVNPEVDAQVNDMVALLTERYPTSRPATADAFAETFERTLRAGIGIARHAQVAALVHELAGEALACRRDAVQEASVTLSVVDMPPMVSEQETEELAMDEVLPARTPGPASSVSMQLPTRSNIHLFVLGVGAIVLGCSAVLAQGFSPTLRLRVPTLALASAELGAVRKTPSLEATSVREAVVNEATQISAATSTAEPQFANAPVPVGTSAARPARVTKPATVRGQRPPTSSNSAPSSSTLVLTNPYGTAPAK